MSKAEEIREKYRKAKEAKQNKAVEKADIFYKQVMPEIEFAAGQGEPYVVIDLLEDTNTSIIHIEPFSDLADAVVSKFSEEGFYTVILSDGNSVNISWDF